MRLEQSIAVDECYGSGLWGGEDIATKKTCQLTFQQIAALTLLFHASKVKASLILAGTLMAKTFELNLQIATS